MEPVPEPLSQPRGFVARAALFASSLVVLALAGGSLLLDDHRSLLTGEAWRSAALPTSTVTSTTTAALNLEHWSVLRPRGAGASYKAFLGAMTKALKARPLGAPCLDWALERIAPSLDRNESLWLEFGVYTGTSLRLMDAYSRRLARKRSVFGFDAFKGLPEHWRGSVFGQGFEKAFTQKGSFSLQGKLPNVNGAELVVGWFNETLPGFLQRERGSVSLLHVDSDLYSSARTVFEAVGPRLKKGAVIVFDELINYVGWKDGEAKALFEWMESPAFKAAGFTALEVLGFRGPSLLVGGSQLTAAIRAQGAENGRFPQDALIRVW